MKLNKLHLVATTLIATSCTTMPATSTAPTAPQAAINVEQTGKFTLKALPYARDALAPYMSLNTVNLHYGAHSLAYINNLNKLIKNSELEKKSLEDIIIYTRDKEAYSSIFNNAAQAWNHELFWDSMTPNYKAPSQNLINVINKNFESFDKFKQEINSAASAVFGSGWVWLVAHDDMLHIKTTKNGENTVGSNYTALFGIDVWEHTYYLDYKNKRGDFVNVFINNLVSWDFVEAKLQQHTEHHKKSGK